MRNHNKILHNSPKRKDYKHKKLSTSRMLKSICKENKKLIILNLGLSLLTSLIIGHFIVNISGLMQSGNYLFLEILFWVPSLIYSLVGPWTIMGLEIMGILRVLTFLIMTAQLFTTGIILTFIIKKIITMSKKELNFKVIAIIILLVFYLPLSIYSANYMSMSESGDKRLDLCFSKTSLTKYLGCTEYGVFWYYMINPDASTYNKKILSICEKIPKDPFPESMMENPNTKRRAEESGFDKQDLCYFSTAIHLNKHTSLDISKNDQVFLCEQTRDRDLCLLYLAEINRFRNSLFLCDLIEDETKKSQCSDLIIKQKKWACEGNFPKENETVKEKCVDYNLYQQN